MAQKNSCCPRNKAQAQARNRPGRKRLAHEHYVQVDRQRKPATVRLGCPVELGFLTHHTQGPRDPERAGVWEGRGLSRSLHKGGSEAAGAACYSW